MSTYTVDQVVAKYIELRDRKKAIMDAAEAQCEPLTQAMGSLENYVLSKMGSEGVDSYKTSAGTAYKINRTSVTTADAQMFRDWVLRPAAEALARFVASMGAPIPPEHLMPFLHASARWGMTDIRPGKKAVEEYIEESQAVPPGLNVTRTTAIGVRRA